jgi:hypothetical protein
MSEPRKHFDCVEMKHRGADAVRKELEGRTPTERLGYWQAKTDELRKRIADRRPVG